MTFFYPFGDEINFDSRENHSRGRENDGDKIAIVVFIDYNYDLIRKLVISIVNLIC